MKNGPPACPLPGGLPHSAAMANRRFYIHINLFSRKMFFHSLAGPSSGHSLFHVQSMIAFFMHIHWILQYIYSPTIKKQGFERDLVPWGAPRETRRVWNHQGGPWGHCISVDFMDFISV